ncbi:glycosyltransferase family 2 protein [Oribacterium sp. FC2011]|uniref:glycosyltransferase family 2 protein n=1 Tax=Oribacterium sp. FC2011 TaxID=1408311 RepID=UPI000679AD6C|nr:glycosyltransferase [Oribacterium sp. FC2011]
MPTVSIIMGVYNCKRPDLLDKSIRSIIGQTYTDWEFIICNDGSTDGKTLELLKSYEALDERIKVLSYDQNHGLAYALNVCLREAGGKYIARQDDESKLVRLQRLVEFADSHPEYAIVGSIADVTDDGGVWGKYPLEETPTKKSFYWNSPFAHPTVLMRREALEAVGGYRISKETNRHEDYDLFMRMYAAGYKGYNIQEKLYEYRIVNGNKKYRPMKNRVNEAAVRFKGFKSLGILGGYRLCDQAGDNRTDSPENFQENQEETVQGLVSVIMPVYNTEEDLLRASIRSIQGQTYEMMELIVVDDGSEKQCAELCDTIADEKTRVYHIENAGASAARNKGINESSGEYIAFIDSDDTVAPNAIEVMVAQIEGVNFVSCGCKHGQTITNSKHAVMRGSEIKDRNDCIEYLCYMSPKFGHIETNAIWGKMYRRCVIGKLRFDTDMIMAEDFKFNFDYIMKCSKGKYLDFEAYNYLERGDSISRIFKPQMMSTIEKLEEMISENEDSSVYDPLISRCVNIAFTILMMVPCELKEERRRIEKFISLYRGQVIRNPQTKKKVRMACLSSFLGFGTTKKIFELSRR